MVPRVERLQDPYADAAQKFDPQCSASAAKDDYKPLGVLGEIKEKGFSSDDRAPLLPEMSVLPFPVARHRSHGPHWAPAPLVTAVKDEELVEMEVEDLVDGRTTALPLEKKSRVGMNLQNWKELLQTPREETSASRAPRPSKTTERRSGNVTAEHQNTFAASETLLPTRKIEPSTKKEEELDTENSGNVTAGRQNTVAASETLFPTGKIVEPSTKKFTEEEEIDAENRAKVFSMTPTEISEAQKDLLERLSLETMNMLRRRGVEKQKKRLAELQRNEDHTTVGVEASNAPETDDQTSEAGVQRSPSAENQATKATAQTTSEDVFTNSWTQRVEAVKLMRFDLTGNVISTDKEELTSFYSVAERDFLRAEGEPAAFGYTIREAADLSRSSVPGQRVIGLKLLGSVLSNAANGLLLHEDDDQTDWQAIWAYALGPHPELVLTLRLALDDPHLTVIICCAKALQAMLSCLQNEKFFRLSEALWPGEPLCYTAPIFRKHVSLEDGCLGGGNWKYNVKSSDLLPKSTIPDESDNTVADDATVATKDVAAGLLKMGILPRLRYILEVEKPRLAEEPLLSIVIALARHSPAAADAVIKCPRLIDIVLPSFFLQEDCTETARSKAIQLVKVLSQASKMQCIEFAESGVLQAAISDLFHPQNRNIVRGLSKQLAVREALSLWKACIHHGIGIHLFADFYPALCTFLSPSAEVPSEAQECYNVLEVLARTLPVLGQEQRDSEAVWSWSIAVPIIQNSLGWFIITDMRTERLATLGSVMHFLATVCERVLRKDNSWLPEFVPQVGLSLVKSRIFAFDRDSAEETIVSMLLNHRGTGDDTETLLTLANCLRAAIRLAFAVDKLLSGAKASATVPSGTISPVEEILHSGIVESAKEELKQLMILVEEIDKAGVLLTEFNGRGGPAPGVGFGWGSSDGGFWSLKLLLAQNYASILLHLDAVLQLSLETKISICAACAVEPSLLKQAFSDHIFSRDQWRSTLAAAETCLSQRKKQINYRLPPECEASREFLTRHHTEIWLQKKKRKTTNPDQLSTIPEEGDEEAEFDRNEVMREWNRMRLPLPSHWIVSPLHLTAKAEGGEVDAQSVLGGLLLLLGIDGASAADRRCNIPLTRKVHALSTVFCAGDLFLDEIISDVLGALQGVYGSQDDGLDFERQVYTNYTVFAEKIALHFTSASYGDLNFGRQVAIYLRPAVAFPIQKTVWRVIAEANMLNLLPRLEDCSGPSSAYLHPPQKNVEALEMYVSTWISGGLDKAFLSKALAFDLAIHHIGNFIFKEKDCSLLLHRKKFARNLIRSSKRNPLAKEMLKALLRYFPGEVDACRMFMEEACDGDASAANEWRRLSSGKG